jgi:hypothetical protein
MEPLLGLRVPVAAAAFLLTWSAAINVASGHEDHGNLRRSEKAGGRSVKVKMFEGSGKMGFDSKINTLGLSEYRAAHSLQNATAVTPSRTRLGGSALGRTVRSP